MIKSGLVVSFALRLRRSLFLTAIACLVAISSVILGPERANSIGFISHHGSQKLPGKWQGKSLNSGARAAAGRSAFSRLHRIKTMSGLHSQLSKRKGNLAGNGTLKAFAIGKGNSAGAIKNLVSNLKVQTLVPGVIYKKGGGALRLNVLDVDTAKAPVVVKPMVAQEGASRLQTVNSYAATNRALAAINANYFKRMGWPWAP